MATTGTLRSLLRHVLRAPRQAAVVAGGTLGVALGWWALARWSGDLVATLGTPGAPGLAGTLGRGVAWCATILALATWRDVTLVRLGATYAAEWRTRLMDALLSQTTLATRAIERGSTVTRMATDITLLHQAAVRALALWLPATVTTLVLGIAIIATAPVVAALLFLLLLPVLLVVRRAGAQHHVAVQRVQEGVARLGQLTEEALAGVTEARVFRREAAMRDAFAREADATVQRMVHEERLAYVLPSLTTLAAALSLAAFLLVVVSVRDRGMVDGVTLTQALALVALLVGPLQEAIRAWPSIARLGALSARCDASMALPQEDDPHHPEPALEPVGAVSFTDVHLAFPGTGFAIGPLSAEIAPGELVAIVGSSGAGKTSLLELVPRLTTPTAGTVRVGRVPVSRQARHALRALVAYVPQHPWFPAGTVRESLQFANPSADDAMLHQACRVAHAREFVMRLPAGLDTVLPPGATTLSAGQRQRLALARALLATPRILLLDEPTAALDEESEALLAEALRTLRGNCTVIVVTHSPRLMAAADRVLHLTRQGLAPSTAGDHAFLATIAR